VPLTFMSNADQRLPTLQDQVAGLLVRVQSGEQSRRSGARNLRVWLTSTIKPPTLVMWSILSETT